MSSQCELQELLVRHRKFWNLEKVDRPLIGKIPTRHWTGRPYPLSDGRILDEQPYRLEPALINIEKMIGLELDKPKMTFGDLFNPLPYRYPQAWMEALGGCEIEASAYSCTAVKQDNVDLKSFARGFSVEKALASDWMNVMNRIIEQATLHANGELAVRQLHLRGIIDMLAAVTGEESLCLACYDTPDSINTLAEKYVELYIAAARNGLARRPLWHGGYCSVWNIWSPGEHIDYQVDASSIFSVDMYEDMFLEYDRRVISSFPYSVIHIHACGLHILDALLKIKALKAIEINLDRETGTWNQEAIIDSCIKIHNSGKAFILHGELSEEELSEFKSRLPTAGTAIFYWNK